MDLVRPLRSLIPTAEADVLGVLALVREDGLTGREIASRAGMPPTSARLALGRLEQSGIVLRSAAGRANLYRLNRDHLAARPIEELASLRNALVARLRERIAELQPAPAGALLFGSVARGDAGPDSDVDLLVIRPDGCTAEDEAWRAQIERLPPDVFRWTGNDARILEVAAAETDGQEETLRNALREGIELRDGSRDALRRAMRRRRSA